uniref:Uncharacterized protein n=1 Tax=Anabas testudineus TaxID=64144 RepID=A0A3Q1I7K0_ANATE
MASFGWRGRKVGEKVSKSVVQGGGDWLHAIKRRREMRSGGMLHKSKRLEVKVRCLPYLYSLPDVGNKNKHIRPAYIFHFHLAT